MDSADAPGADEADAQLVVRHWTALSFEFRVVSLSSRPVRRRHRRPLGQALISSDRSGQSKRTGRPLRTDSSAARASRAAMVPSDGRVSEVAGPLIPARKWGAE